MNQIKGNVITLDFTSAAVALKAGAHHTKSISIVPSTETAFTRTAANLIGVALRFEAASASVWRRRHDDRRFGRTLKR